MSADPIRFALQTPGHIRFPVNQPFVDHFEQAGGVVARQSTGHLVFYRPDGPRFLATDPAGHPLHECEWTKDERGGFALSRARIRLDWGAWVGIKPAGLVNETTLNLATKPGWQRLSADDLRAMAAQALHVPIDEVRWFYSDEDLSIDQNGRAVIRHRKDAFYLLEQGDLERARFMSCMGAMHWASIDFLPVVELFKSLLPGTGSAAFELIRGLYDDQHRDRQIPLRYRGIPTYPSEAAFRLFSNYFVPQPPKQRDAFSLFMDPARAHEVLWLPSPLPPLRYLDESHHCCLTFQGGRLQKATLADDAGGLPYVNPMGRKFAPCERTAQISEGRVVLHDRNYETILPIPLPPEIREQPLQPIAISPVDWRSLFVQGLPPIAPLDAFGAALLYPESEAEISELASQPFVADYIQDLAEQDRDIGVMLARADRIFIENGDAVIATCVSFDRPRDYTVLVRAPAYAQKQAQHLWNLCAELQRWDWLTRIQFLPIKSMQKNQALAHPHDLAYLWIPHAMGDHPGLLSKSVRELGARLRSGGKAFVVGPAGLAGLWPSLGFRLSWQEAVEGLPTFRMHRTILPKAKLKAGLTLYHASKM